MQQIEVVEAIAIPHVLDNQVLVSRNNVEGSELSQFSGFETDVCVVVCRGAIARGQAAEARSARVTAPDAKRSVAAAAVLASTQAVVNAFPTPPK